MFRAVSKSSRMMLLGHWSHDYRVQYDSLLGGAARSRACATRGVRLRASGGRAATRGRHSRQGPQRDHPPVRRTGNSGGQGPEGQLRLGGRAPWACTHGHGDTAWRYARTLRTLRVSPKSNPLYIYIYVYIYVLETYWPEAASATPRRWTSRPARSNSGTFACGAATASAEWRRQGALHQRDVECWDAVETAPGCL